MRNTSPSGARKAAEIEEARALRDHPELIRLREIQALAEMAKSGARFVVGLPVEAPGLSLLDQGEAAKPRR